MTEEGEVYAWGDNRSSQLGVTNESIGKKGSPFTSSATPILVSFAAGLRVRMVAAGGCYSAAILDNGLLYTWGTLDDSIGKSIATPTKVDLLKGVSCVAIGLNHVAVVAESNTPERRSVYTWGSNKKGQLGVVGDSITSAPRKVTLGPKALSVSAGDEFTAAIVEGNEVFVWGNNKARQIAPNTTDEIVSIPMKPFLGRDITELSSARNYIAARTSGGNVCVWGANENVCRAGDADKMIIFPNRIKQVSAGLTHILALTERGEVFAWGLGEDGQLGHEDKKSVATFKKIAALEGRNATYVHAWGRCSSAILEPGNFRVEIGEAMRRPENVGAPAPLFIRKLMHFIRGDNAKLEGIFRLSGSKARVDELEKRLDSNENFSLSKYEVFDAADNLKRYFKSLPEPIFTNSLCARYEREMLDNDDEEACKTMAKKWISELPLPNQTLLLYLLSFLDDIVDSQNRHQKTNAMSAKNLALVFAPNLLTKGEIGNDDIIECMINSYDDIIEAYPDVERAIIVDQANDGLRNGRKIQYTIDLWTRVMARRESARRSFYEVDVLTAIIDAIVDNCAPGRNTPGSSPSHSPKQRLSSSTMGFSLSSSINTNHIQPVRAPSSPVFYNSLSSPQLTASGSASPVLSHVDILKQYEQILSLVLSPVIPTKGLLKVLPSIFELDDVLYVEESLNHWTKQSETIYMYLNQILEYFKWWNATLTKTLNDQDERVLRLKKEHDKMETEKNKIEKGLANTNKAPADEASQLKADYERWCFGNQNALVDERMAYTASQINRFVTDKANTQAELDAFKSHMTTVDEFVSSSTNALKKHIESLSEQLVNAPSVFNSLSNQYIDLIFKFHHQAQDNSTTIKEIADTVTNLSQYFNKPSPLISLELETKFNSIKRL
eukprot:gene3441-3908_t